MRISCSTVTYNIPFAFKDPKDIRDEVFRLLQQTIESSTSFKERHGDSDLMIFIALDRKPDLLEVRGPSTGNNLVDYTIWLPYKRIKQCQNYELEYLEALIEGLRIIFSKYSMGTSELELIREKVSQEIRRKV